MRVLVTGGGGLLGGALLRSAPPEVELHATVRGAPAAGAATHPVELTDAGSVRRAWDEARPDLVIHTAFDTRAGEREIADAHRNVARACRETGAALVHLSTDALLDGKHAPYDETAAPAPVHEYGRLKALAEAGVREECPDAAVVRTSLLVRADPPDRTTAWAVDALRRGEPVRLFTDELRCPVAVDDLAAQLWELAALPAAERSGVWNLAGPEAISRYALGLLIAARYGLDPRGIVPLPSAASPAPRPRDLRMTTARADHALRTRPRGVSVVLAPTDGA
ncbi:MAG TPA: sugar nucleotide-binding protein [Longimicrobiaceae bacterium]|nr:sugar nucleotide-binding protein [Longimicrobiaceae bacterium]